MGLIDFSKFTFSAEQIRNINELVKEELFKVPEIAELHTLHNGIVYDKEVGFIYGGGLVGKAGQGCNPTAQDWTIDGRKITWTPKEWEIYLEQCAKDIENTCAVYSLNHGTRIDDLTDTDYMAIVVQFLVEAVQRMLYRFIWLGDTEALANKDESLPTATLTTQSGTITGTVYKAVTATTEGAVKCATAARVVVWLNGTAASGTAESGASYYSKNTSSKIIVNNGGTYTTGIDVDYFNVLDGLFKQTRAIVASDSKAGYTISANSASTKAAQMSSLTESAAYNLLSGMYYKAPIKLRQDKAKLRFMVTQTIADKYEQYLTGKGIEATYKNLVNGIPTLTFNGVPVIPMPIWDEQIQAYQDLGTTYYKPHRAILTQKEVLAVGTPDNAAFGDVDLYYDRKSRQNCVTLKDKLDAKIAAPKMLIYAE